MDLMAAKIKMTAMKRAMMLRYHRLECPTTLTSTIPPKSIAAPNTTAIGYDWVARMAIPWIWRHVIASSNFWTAFATVVIAVATIVYTHYARQQWSAMNDTLSEIRKQTPEIQKQAAAAQAQLAQTESQWEAQERPWIGLDQSVELPPQLTVQVFDSRKTYSGIEVGVVVKIKNYGLTPAFRVSPQVDVIQSANNTVNPPQIEMKSTCSLADQPSNIEGNVIFPGGDFTGTFDKGGSRPVQFSEIQRIWVLGCIAYWGAADKQPHHTKFWIFSNLIQTNIHSNPIKRELGRGDGSIDFFSIPITGWNLMKTEAD